MKKSVLCVTVYISLFISLWGKSKDSDRKQTKREIRNHKFAYGLNSEIKEIQNQNEKAFLDYFETLSVEEKVSQLFIINLEGNRTFTPVDRRNGKPYVPGGYLFFSYNLADTPAEVKNFTNDINAWCKKNNVIPPFLAVDEEGGYVQRLRKLAGKIPSQMDVAESRSVPEAYELYSSHAVKMDEMGFHMNLAPVVEILSDYNRDFLENRSFGNLEKTRDYSIAELNGYQNNGISCVLKHFPGNTNTDPHTGLPEITLSREELEEALVPFRRVVEHGPDAVLMSHARTSVADSHIPACFSKYWVTEKLRKEMGFAGIIMSDDIFMGALADHGYPPETACVKAIEAGIDCIMISEKRFAKPAEGLIKKAESDPVFASRIDESCKRILQFKIRKGIFSF